MRLGNLRVSTWLKASLGLITASVALLGLLAAYQTDRLWQDTQDMYDHPLATRRAVGELRADVLTIHVRMEELTRNPQGPMRQSILQTIDAADADAERQFAKLEQCYLGPRTEIEAARDALIRWRAIRAETLRLLQAGLVTEAAGRLDSSGISDLQAVRIDDLVQQISRFATLKSQAFRRDAEATRDRLRRQLVVALAALGLLALGLGFALLRAIRSPLKELTETTESYRRGNLAARCRYTSPNELGLLADSVNALADTVQKQLKNRENVGRLSEIMLREDDLHRFSQAMLAALIELTDSQLGALYLLNESGTEFQHFASIGLPAGATRSFSAPGHEGEFGPALATRKIVRTAAIPPDTRFAVATVAGQFLPRETVTLPIVRGGDVVAVVSLASLRAYDEEANRLLDDVWSMLTARLNGVLASHRLRALTAKIESQNAELQAQTRELSVQANELRERNAELEVQKTQLNEANRLKSVFLSTMSHELRTPLNAVNALAGVLIRRLEGVIPAEEHGYLHVIQRNGNHLLALINDILDLSRIEAGREELALARVTVGELVDAVLGTVEPQAREKGLEVRNRVAADLPPIVSDFGKCRHILQNLLSNAVKFTEKGHVEVSARLVDGELLISVADTGVGIADEFRPHIFDEFRQADESLSRKYGGTGLGLAIARRYATMLNGRIAVETARGKGSTFTLAVPATPPGTTDLPALAPGVRPHSSAPPLPDAGRGQSILVVEDSEPVAIQITDVLTRQGYRVRVARQGDEALKQVEQTPPDAMILDLMMPGVDGFQVLQTLRATERGARLPVVILTAKHLTADDLAVLRSNHIEQVIQKGDVSRAELLAAVARLLQGVRP